ncbi:MAG TPA: YfhO family protein, partial [Caldilineaceae bacterium]|nr:YfhO family protein [Caldilineaceae bacterium]
WLFGIRYNPTLDPQLVYPTPHLVQYLRSRDDSIYRIMGVNLALIPNVSMVFSLQDIRGYEPVTPKRYMDLISRLDGALRIGDHLLFTHANAAFLDFLNVKYAFSAVPLGGAWIPLLQDGDATLYENRHVLPRAFLVYEGRWAASPEESLAMTLAADFDFRQSVVLEGDPQSGVSPQPGAAPASGAEQATGDPLATVTSYQPEQMTVQVDTPAPGFLVLSESYAPGWVASVDGEPVNLLIANHAFRAVRVPAGEHRVTFHYHPIWFTWGARISIIGLALLVFLPVLGERRWFTPSRQAATRRS